MSQTAEAENDEHLVPLGAVAPKEIRQHLAERVAAELALYANFRAAARGDEASDGTAWRAAPEVTLPAVLAQLRQHFGAHIASERQLLAGYRELSERSDVDEEVRYLMQILVRDEESHHQFFRDMATAFGDKMSATRQSGFQQAPVEGIPRVVTPQLLKQITQQFLAAEREDQRQLRVLHSELRPLLNSNFWSLLVELMRLDNQKHIHLLRYIRHHVDQLARPAK